LRSPDIPKVFNRFPYQWTDTGTLEAAKHFQCGRFAPPNVWSALEVMPDLPENPRILMIDQTLPLAPV
jgi:hypothetical protein